MQLIKDGTIILDLDNVVETNHISCQTMAMSPIQFGCFEPAVLYVHGLPSPATQEGFFPVNVFEKLAVNMTSCSEVKELSEEDGRRENSSKEINKTMAALEAMPICLNWGRIFSMFNEMLHHVATALKHLELFANKVGWPSSEKMVYFQSAR